MTEAELNALRITLSPLPKHVGIIMDGNGRYATRRGLPRSMGHRAGTERLRGIIKLSSDLGIGALSLYAFSTENWKRPKIEVDTLFAIFMEYFTKEVEDLHKNNVAIRAMGNIAALPEKVCAQCMAAMEKTKNNTGLKLNIALNYGSRAETVNAVKSIALDAKEGRLNIEDIDEECVMSEADEFVQLDVAADSGVDYCYEAKKGGETIGYVAKATADGYGGKIEVTVGIDNNGMITGISCGGSGFSETPGLGAKVKEAKFSDQFAGMSAPVSITKDGGTVDSVTAASRSSRAVCKAVNAACDYVAAMGN